MVMLSPSFPTSQPQTPPQQQTSNISNSVPMSPGGAGFGAGNYSQNNNQQQQQNYQSQPQQTQPQQTPPWQGPSQGFQNTSQNQFVNSQQNMPSVENQALQGNNPQSIQNFMAALNNVGAGSNNAQMQGGTGTPIQQQNLYNGPPANATQPQQSYGSYNPQNGAYANLGNVFNQQGQQNPAWLNAVNQGYSVNQNANAASQVSQNQLNPGWLNNVNSGAQANPMQANQFANQSTFIPQNQQSTAAAPAWQGRANYQSMPYYANNPITASQVTQNQQASQNQTPAPAWMQNINNPASMQTPVVSDETAKQDIKPNKDLSSFMQSLTSNSYEYKDKADGAGRYVSPMAQDLLKTEVGKSAVEQDENGKLRVHPARLDMVMMSALGQLHDRLSNLEKK